MQNHINWAARCCAIVLACVALQANAAECDDAWAVEIEVGNDPFTAFYSLYELGCFGGEKDPLVTQWRERLKWSADTKLSSFDENLLALFDNLIEQSLLIDATIDPSNQTKAATRTAYQRLVAGSATEGEIAAKNWQIIGDGELGGAAQVSPQLNLEQWVGDNCQSRVLAECQPAVDTARIYELARYALLQRALPIVTTARERADAELKRWQAYRTESLPMYWWEWWANTPVIRSYLNKTEDSEEARVPNWQVILFHPAVGLDYVNAGTDGAAAGALYLEVIGFNNFERGFGASLVGVVADHKTTDDFGYGVMFHVKNRYSLAVTQRDGDWGVIVGVDLAALYRGWLNRSKIAAEQIEAMRPNK